MSVVPDPRSPVADVPFPRLIVPAVILNPPVVVLAEVKAIVPAPDFVNCFEPLTTPETSRSVPAPETASPTLNVTPL